MTEQEKRKLAAAGRIGLGAFRVISGVALAFGHGLGAIFLKTPASRTYIATKQIQAGEKTFKQGLAEWNA